MGMLQREEENGSNRGKEYRRKGVRMVKEEEGEDKTSEAKMNNKETKYCDW